MTMKMGGEVDYVATPPRKDAHEIIELFDKDTQSESISRPDQLGQLIKAAFAGMSAKTRTMLEGIGVTAATYPVPPIEIINPRRGFDVDRITQFTSQMSRAFLQDTVKFIPMQSSTEIILTPKMTSVISVALKSMWEALTNNVGVHWYTVAKVMLWDASIMAQDDAKQEFGCRRILARKFQAGGLATALPDDDVLSTGGRITVPVSVPVITIPSGTDSVLRSDIPRGARGLATHLHSSRSEIGYTTAETESAIRWIRTRTDTAMAGDQLSG
jgi:hypothetical protein